MAKPKDYWEVRRRLVTSTLSFCYIIVLFLIAKGQGDSKLHESISSGIMMLMTGTIVGYIGAAVYDDINDEAVEKDKDYWLVRRWLVITNVIFSFGCVVFMLIYPQHDSRLHSSMVVELLLTTVIVMVSYVGGSSIQDKYMKKIK